MEKKTLLNSLYVVFAVFAILYLQQTWQQVQEVKAIPYSEFLQDVKGGKLDKVVVTDQHVIGRLKKPQGEKTEVVANRVDPAVVDELGGSVQITGAVESHFLHDLLSWVVPATVFFALWMLLYRRFAERAGGGGLMSIGKSRAKVYMVKDTRVRFADVAGAAEAKEELEEIVQFLKDRQRYGRLGAQVPKGVLLVGPPGTGKTLLARAVAGEASVAFFSISGSEFVEMFVGVGAARVRDLFEQARGHAPAIIFIDELDALGRARNSYLGIGGHDEREQTLNQLLTELDGFDPREGVVLLAATNRPEVLDPALLRAGRFDRHILVDRPDRHDRIEILKVHARKIRLAADANTEQVAALTPGFTGADLANLVNEAALLATRRQAEAVTLADFSAAIERMIAGLEKRNRLLIPKEREIVAYHEMGHALTALAIPDTDTVHKVSIIPRGIGALGYTIQRPVEDRYLMTRDELKNKIAVLLGGRAAEELVFDQLSTGAADDLAKATEIARSMVTRFGMDEDLGSVSFEAEHAALGSPGAVPYPEHRYSEATAERIDGAVTRILSALLARTLVHLKTNRAVLDEAARLLLAEETVDESQLRRLASKLHRFDERAAGLAGSSRGKAADAHRTRAYHG